MGEPATKKQRVQPDYSKGKIYILKDRVNGRFYIGSTTQPTVEDRLIQHERQYRSWLNGKNSYCASYQIISNDDYKIKLLENWNCNSRSELTQRERYWQEQMPQCINRNRAFRTREEELQDKRQNYLDNREDRLEYKRQHYQDNREQRLQYYQDNREQLLQAQARPWRCEICDITITFNKRRRHQRSQRHLRNVEQQREAAERQAMAMEDVSV